MRLSNKAKETIGGTLCMLGLVAFVVIVMLAIYKGTNDRIEKDDWRIAHVGKEVIVDGNDLTIVKSSWGNFILSNGVEIEEGNIKLFLK